MAELRPLAASGSPEEAGLAALQALGVVTRTAQAQLTPSRPVRSSGRPASEALSESREDRF